MLLTLKNWSIFQKCNFSLILCAVNVAFFFIKLAQYIKHNVSAVDTDGLVL